MGSVSILATLASISVAFAVQATGSPSARPGCKGPWAEMRVASARRQQGETRGEEGKRVIGSCPKGRSVEVRRQGPPEALSSGQKGGNSEAITVSARAVALFAFSNPLYTVALENSLSHLGWVLTRHCPHGHDYSRLASGEVAPLCHLSAAGCIPCGSLGVVIHIGLIWLAATGYLEPFVVSLVDNIVHNTVFGFRMAASSILSPLLTHMYVTSKLVAAWITFVLRGMEHAVIRDSAVVFNNAGVNICREVCTGASRNCADTHQLGS
ncbi:hypothetical protein EXIGLDRAFT_697118 [Exidia glandulosa HHB12029]|uniref:Uncharacterized protein n=1 Tax=Exidia glandulosa HHB12029 TaxID=1314781 RepID=A0A165N110_EXIGL|nr:hypothetical protein EXIGLDRAFT_697118 [Exidia glandulosa HHB12029]